MHVSCLSLVLVAVGTMKCTERESLIRQISIVETTQCLMDCTVLTFSKITELGDNRNIRMKDSSQEEQRSKNGIFYNFDMIGRLLKQRGLVVTIFQPFQHA